MKKPSVAAAFSLVELTLALGIAAFCLIAVFGLMPVGIQTNRNATSQTAATNILSSVVSDLRGSPPGQGRSAKYSIFRNKGSRTTVCFDGQGAWIPPTMANDVACTNNSLQQSNSRYRLIVHIDPFNPGLVVYPTYANLRVTWPALAGPSVKPSGSIETVATYFVK